MARKKDPSILKSQTLTIRLTDAQRARLEQASNSGPYRVAMTEIIARGIELAARELERMAERTREDA